MAISGKFFPETIYLIELETSCEIALASLANLRAGYAAQQGQHKSGSAHHAAPINRVMNAQSFLTQCAAISRILFLGKRKGSSSNIVQKRCTRLRRLLGIHSMKNLESFPVRNAWEHMDERLDGIFQKWTGEKISIEPIRVMNPNAASTQQVLRGIDPINERLYFKNKSFDLKSIEKDLNKIKSRIKDAMAKLKNNKKRPLFPK